MAPQNRAWDFHSVLSVEMMMAGPVKKRKSTPKIQPPPKKKNNPKKKKKKKKNQPRYIREGAASGYWGNSNGSLIAGRLVRASEKLKEDRERTKDSTRERIHNCVRLEEEIWAA